MAGAVIALTANAGEFKNDGNGNAMVNLPTTLAQAGFARVGFIRDAATARALQVTEEGLAKVSQGHVLFHCSFNGAAAGALVNNQWNQQTTTMATALNAGFLRFNNAAVTTINTGAAIVTWRTFSVNSRNELSLSAHIKHNNGAVSNKQFDFGFGYYDVASIQGAAMNEFIGYRWTQAGNLLGVLEYSAGGAATTITVNINGGVPYADNAAKRYGVRVTGEGVEFWVDGVFQASIARQADAPGAIKASGYPIVARLFNGASVPSGAPVFDLGEVSVIRHGYEVDMAMPISQVLQGRHSNTNQQGLTTTNGNTALIQASGTAPTATTGSNTAGAIVGLGGYYQLNGASFVATQHSNILVSSYLNPVVPETAGAANDGRNLVITDLSISPMVVMSALTGGGAVWEWFIAVGATSLSMAASDAIGGNTPGTSSPHVMPLAIVDSIAAAAAAGVVATRVGDSTISLQTPLVVFPGQYVLIGVRTLSVAAAITAGTFTGGIGVSGFWE